MDWRIPQEVFDTYKAAVDAMITDNFGVECTLITVERVETIASNPATNNIPTRNSVNSHRKRGGGGYDRGEVTVTETETTSTIKMRCYWTSKDWVKLDNNSIVDPEAKVMTIGYLSDFPAIRRSKAVQMRPNLSDNASRRRHTRSAHVSWARRCV